MDKVGIVHNDGVPMERLLGVREAARLLQVHENTVRNFLRNGTLRAYRLPSGVRRIPAGEVEPLLVAGGTLPTSDDGAGGARRAG